MTDLVFDIGMFDGEDTAYYLERGYSVVAVEANPLLCEAAERRFAEALSTGRLTIVNQGIVDEPGEHDFWVSEHLDWSSFDNKNATKGNATTRAIKIPTVRFSELLNGFPAARHMKIDIEGMDTSCLHALAECEHLPASLSFEAHPDAAADVSFLAELGYDVFKCVRQNDFSEMTPRNVAWQSAWQGWLGWLQRQRFLGIASHALRRLHYRHQDIAGHDFREGSSGPLGWELPGPWLDRAQLLMVWQRLLKTFNHLNPDKYTGGGEWFDIHAAIAAELPIVPFRR